MKLLPKFEVVQAVLLNRNPVPLLNVCVDEFLLEEQWMATLASIGAKFSSSEVVNIAYVAQGYWKGQFHCFHCKGHDHFARN